MKYNQVHVLFRDGTTIVYTNVYSVLAGVNNIYIDYLDCESKNRKVVTTARYARELVVEIILDDEKSMWI